MRAAVVPAPGASPHPAEFAEPESADGCEILRLVGAGIHQVVRSRAAGTHYSTSGRYPLVPGVDAVARTADGRLVYTGWIQPPWGTMAERMCAQVGTQLPQDCDPLAVAAGMNPGLSGYLPLSARLQQLGALGIVAVLGATGMSGRLAVQSALALGADRVIALARNRDALARFADARVTTVHLDADPSITTAATRSALAGADPSIVLDYLWGPPAEAVFAALMPTSVDDEGTADIGYVSIGSVTGDHAAIPSALLRARRITITGSGLGSVPVQTLMQRIPQFMALIASGAVHVPYRAFPISDATAAWAWAGDGRAVITPDPATP